MITAPYPHVATADTLVDYAALRDGFPADDRFGPQIRMHDDLTHPDPEYLRLTTDAPAYRRLHDWVYSADFVVTFLSLFDSEIAKHVVSGDLMMDPDIRLQKLTKSRYRPPAARRAPSRIRKFARAKIGI